MKNVWKIFMGLIFWVLALITGAIMTCFKSMKGWGIFLGGALVVYEMGMVIRYQTLAVPDMKNPWIFWTFIVLVGGVYLLNFYLCFICEIIDVYHRQKKIADLEKIFPGANAWTEKLSK